MPAAGAQSRAVRQRDPPMSKLQAYRDYLTRQGYRPEARDDYVCFRHEGGTFILPAEDQDPTYFRLVFPNFWPITSPEERTLANATACDVTASLKGVKVFPLGDSVSATIELFLPNTDAWQSVFVRSVQVLQLAVRRFCTGMTAAAAQPDAMAPLRALLEDKDPPVSE